jgi:hypothetical protein
MIKKNNIYLNLETGMKFGDVFFEKTVFEISLAAPVWLKNQKISKSRDFRITIFKWILYLQWKKVYRKKITQNDSINI